MIRQPRRGYRFSLDAVLLARFVKPSSRSRVLELGAGCGVISMIVGKLICPKEVVALEIQTELSDLAAANARLNDLNIKVVTGDLRARKIESIQPASFDYVVANPPFRAHGTGRQSLNASRMIARSESAATLPDFISAATRFCRFGGKVGFVFTAARMAELIEVLRSHRLEPKRLKLVHPLPHSAASMVLIESSKGGGVELLIEPPLIVHSAPGVYSREARLLLSS